MNNFEKRLDEIAYWMYESSGNSPYVRADRATLNPEEAKQAIRTLILEEVIGENERTNQMESPTWNYVGGQNALRAEQRQKVKGDDDE